MRILVTPRQRFDGDAIAPDLARDRRQIFRRGDDVELGLGARAIRADERRAEDNSNECDLHDSLLLADLRVRATCGIEWSAQHVARAPLERVGAVRADGKKELEKELVRVLASRKARAAVLPAHEAEFRGLVGQDERLAGIEQ